MFYYKAEKKKNDESILNVLIPASANVLEWRKFISLLLSWKERNERYENILFESRVWVCVWKHKRISLRIKNHAVSSVHPFSSSYFVPLTHFFFFFSLLLQYSSLYKYNKTRVFVYNSTYFILFELSLLFHFISSLSRLSNITSRLSL